MEAEERSNDEDQADIPQAASKTSRGTRGTQKKRKTVASTPLREENNDDLEVRCASHRTMHPEAKILTHLGVKTAGNGPSQQRPKPKQRHLPHRDTVRCLA